MAHAVGREEPVSWARKGGREGSDPIFTKTFFLFKPTGPGVPKHRYIDYSNQSRIPTGSVIIADPHLTLLPLRPAFTLPTYRQGEEDPEVLYSI